jgi:ABC-2 type transport system ATP-binding protein
VQGPLASTLRTRADLIKAMASPLAYPRPGTEAELDAFLGSRGSRYFELQDAAGKPYGFAGNSGPLRQVPTLLLQGNRDVLFNLTEGWRNFTYFGSTGADVRLLSTEGGHMNPLAEQKEGTASCGKLQGVNTIMAWFDHYLKGASSQAFSEIPKVCISVADTVGAPDVADAGLFLDRVPVGSQSGTGGVAALAQSLSASVVLGSAPLFLPVKTIPDAGLVLAGIPRLASITVTPGQGAVQAALAYIGIGILRAGELILVDDQVTPFAQGIHASNRGENNHEVNLPGIGEQLQKGDVIGLLLYENHPQYLAVVSTASAPNLPFVAGSITGVPLPAVGVGPSLPNPYKVVITGAELPVLAPVLYPGSKLSQ